MQQTNYERIGEREYVEFVFVHDAGKGADKLVALCKEHLGWTKATTYTVIRRLSERGVLKNENTVVSALVSKDEVQAAEINEMVEKTFEGSLPAFIAAFTKHQQISEKEVDAIQKMIDRYRKGEK